jgi:hypothetical protein
MSIWDYIDLATKWQGLATVVLAIFFGLTWTNLHDVLRRDKEIRAVLFWSSVGMLLALVVGAAKSKIQEFVGSPSLGSWFLDMFAAFLGLAILLLWFYCGVTFLAGILKLIKEARRERLDRR